MKRTWLNTSPAAVAERKHLRVSVAAKRADRLYRRYLQSPDGEEYCARWSKFVEAMDKLHAAINDKEDWL